MWSTQAVVLGTTAGPEHAPHAVRLDGAATGGQGGRPRLPGRWAVLLGEPGPRRADHPRRGEPHGLVVDDQVDAGDVVGVVVGRVGQEGPLLRQGQEPPLSRGLGGAGRDQAGRLAGPVVDGVPVQLAAPQGGAVLEGVLADAALDLDDPELGQVGPHVGRGLGAWLEVDGVDLNDGRREAEVVGGGGQGGVLLSRWV